MSILSRYTLPRAITAHWKRIALALIIAIIAVTAGVYLAFVHVYKSDYQHALAQVNQAIISYNTLLTARDNAVLQAVADDKSFDGAVVTYRQKFNVYAENVRSLSGERALQDDAVKKAYDALTHKNNTFNSFILDRFELLTLIHKVTLDCSDSALSKLNTSNLGELVAAYDTATSACAADMKSLSTQSDSSAAKKGKDAATYLTGMRNHAVAMQDAYTTGNRTTFEAEYNAFLENVAQYKTYTYVRDLVLIDKSIAPTSELNQLASTINARQK